MNTLHKGNNDDDDDDDDNNNNNNHNKGYLNVVIVTDNSFIPLHKQTLFILVARHDGVLTTICIHI